jgi:hypothetical protein
MSNNLNEKLNMLEIKVAVIDDKVIALGKEKDSMNKDFKDSVLRIEEKLETKKTNDNKLIMMIMLTFITTLITALGTLIMFGIDYLIK